VPPEDGRLTPETCRGLRHNKVFVIVKVKVYQVGYAIVIKFNILFLVTTHTDLFGVDSTAVNNHPKVSRHRGTLCTCRYRGQAAVPREIEGHVFSYIVL
jgi:hypothetical protein